MNIFASLITDMRQKKLWPLALVLVALLVALPILLTKSSSPIAITPVSPVSNGSSVPQAPSITAQVNPLHSALKGHKHNPFAPSVKTKSTTTQSKTSKANSGSSAQTKSSTSTGATTHTTTTPAGSTPTTSTPATTPTQPTGPTQPVTPVKVVPVGLSPVEVYDVSLSMTNSSGGFDTIRPLERLSVLPSVQKPLLVELGVLKGGKRVLFAVQNGAALSGPGSCIPGPVDCELLELRPGQLEQLSGQTPGGVVYSELSISKIVSRKLKSKAAARTARIKTSSAGFSLLKNTTSSVLSLFPYDAKIGAILDRRNLGAGGN